MPENFCTFCTVFLRVSAVTALDEVDFILSIFIILFFEREEFLNIFAHTPDLQVHVFHYSDSNCVR